MGEQSKAVAVPKVMDVVIFHTTDGTGVPGIVVAVWDAGEVPMVNVVHACTDVSRQDSYGRQTEHASSVCHGSQVTTHGYYWRWQDETPNPVVQPTER